MKKTSINKSKIDVINSKLWMRRYDDPSAVVIESNKVLSKAEKAEYFKGMAYARLNIAASSFLQSKNETTLEKLSESLQ